jgi:hypothetical protein
MLILQPHIFSEFPEIIFGFSTKFGENEKPPYYFNLSLSVDDDRNKVSENREKFFTSLGLSSNKIAIQKQVHRDTIIIVNKPGSIGESDAMISDKTGLGLCISTADCTPVFIFDRRKKIIAAIHSGWRGTEKRITEKTIGKLRTEFNSIPEDLFAYLAPSISQVNYEVGSEVAELFDSKYLIQSGNKFLLDVSSANYDMLINEGIPPYQIQKSSLCSFEYSEVFHSYRRDGKISGRALGLIAMKETL